MKTAKSEGDEQGSNKRQLARSRGTQAAKHVILLTAQ
jgi:hypothetical protein